ncbi:MAG TPA: HAD-IB family hydrolase [Polyangia bacterium]|jgi:HAD superfamily hydrolase (TIGR01490 family)
MSSAVAHASRSYFAFFDIDYTLIDCSSGMAFGLECLRAGVIGLGDIARAVWWHTAYQLGLMAETEIWHLSTGRVIGRPEAPIRLACQAAHRRRVRHRVYREARDALARHRAAGGVPALISAAPRYNVLELARELGIEHTATAWANVIDGKMNDLTGVEIPVGPMKRVFAQRLCTAHGVAPADCWAYGDSRADIEMLELVGHPVAVNPKPALLRVARARGWTIARWHEPSAAQ